MFHVALLLVLVFKKQKASICFLKTKVESRIKRGQRVILLVNN